MHHFALLRLDDRQDHHPRPRPAGGDCAHEADAGDGDRRGHQDDDSDAPQDSERSRFHRRPAPHPFHGAVPAEAESLVAGGIRLILPHLYSIIDVEVCARSGWTPRDLARAHLNGGVWLLQLRAKTLDSGPFLELASAIAEDARSAGATFIINDRADLAVLS